MLALFFVPGLLLEGVLTVRESLAYKALPPRRLSGSQGIRTHREAGAAFNLVRAARRTLLRCLSSRSGHCKNAFVLF